MLRRRCVTLFVNCELVKKLWQQSENPGINGDTGTSSGHASERSCQEDTGWQPSRHKSVTSLLSTVSSEMGRVQRCFHRNSLRYLRNFSKLAVSGSHSSSVSFQAEVWWTVWRRKQRLNHICDRFHPTSSTQNTEITQLPKHVPWMETRGEWFPVKKDVSTSKPPMRPGTPSWMMHQSWPSTNTEMDAGV